MADTDVAARVWPEDTGTGAADGNEDWDSAGYIGGMAAKDNASDYVEAGLGITTDYATPAFDLAAGLAYIKHTGSVSIQLPSDDASTYSGTWDQGVTFAVDVDAETGIALTDGAVNRVYLATDLSTNDGAYIRVDTEASPNVPTDPYIKIAEIDTSNDTTTEEARRPDVAVGDLDVDQLASALDAAGYDITGAGAIEGQSASFSGGVDASSASVDALWNESDLLLIGTSGQFIERRDPSNSTTPVTDAINDLEAASGGEVWIPPGGVGDEGPLPCGDFVTVKGTGHGGNNASEIRITGGGRGIENINGNAKFGGFEGVKITNESGLGNATGAGVYLGDVIRQFDWDIRLNGWEQPFICDSASYENDFHRLFIANCDAGNQNGLIDIQNIGPTNEFGLIAAYPTDSLSGADSKILYLDGGGANTEIEIRKMNIGGKSSWAIDRRSLEYLHVGIINWEPNNPNTIADRVIFHSNDFDGRYDFLRINGDATNAYHFNGGGPTVGRVDVDGSLSGDKIYVNTDIGESIVYEGSVPDVNNDSGANLSNPVVTLADVTKKVSTGVGYDGGTDDSQL